MHYLEPLAAIGVMHTRRQRLLELLGLLGVLQDQGVQVRLAPDLELDLVRLLVLLDPRRCFIELYRSDKRAHSSVLAAPCCSLGRRGNCFLDRQSTGSLVLGPGKLTGSILPPADLDELFVCASVSRDRKAGPR